MFAKRPARALTLLLALPSAAFALGLGDIHLLSPLNAPLDAEIELTDVAADELNTVQVALASRDTFARYGLEWPAYLSGIQLKTVRTQDGREMIKVRSSDPITEPFVTLLVQVTWSRGVVVREYTMLLDPPVYTPGESAAASAPVAAPNTSPGVREGSIARQSEAPAAATPAPSAPAAAASAAETASAAPAPAPAPSRPARATHVAPPAPAPSEAAGTSHTVTRGETLSAIAAGVAGGGVSSPSTRSWMLAIYQANPQAFRQNMNVLRSGAVLRIPDASDAAAIAPAEASAEIRRQYAAWRGAAAAPAAAAEKPGRLKLVTPAENAPAPANATPQAPTAAGTPPPSAKTGAAASQQAAANEAKRLLELKNQELARIQAQEAAQQAAAKPAPAAPPPAAVTPPAATAPAPAPVESAPAPTDQTSAPAPAVETAPAPPPVVAKTPPPQPKPAASSGSFISTLLGLWWVLALLIALGLLGFFGSRLLRARRKSEFDDSLGRLAAEGAETADLGPISARGSFSDPDLTPAPAPAPRPASRSPAAALPEAAFLVEETGSHERPRLSATGTQPAMAAPKHVASDETISSETAINLDQGDPLAEADFHMAYGLYDQAADLIRIAISREPNRRDLKLKLLEVFFVWGNKEQFLTAARELAQTRSEAAPGEWEKILIMGKQLAPEDPLFSGGGTVTGAAAGGVDLDLEGGQSRVDFDLLGDPVPAEAHGGVDLDIGSAVGDLDATAESQSGITDRNVALLENSFTGNNTGSTRQMTSRMRQGGGSTAEMEGPTVEQPQLSPSDNPTLRQKLENVMRQGSAEHTAELAIDDLGLDVGAVDTIDQPGIASAAASTPDTPTLVAGLDEQSRRVMEDAHRRAKEETGETTGAWQFDQNELEAALTQTTNLAGPDGSATSRLRALSGHSVDLDVGDATGTHVAHGDVDLDVGLATGTHEAHGGTLDLDVGTATVPDAAFAATQRLASEDLALPDLEPVTMSEVGTKLDLARAYMDMGDPDGARNILEEVLHEGSAAQKQEAQRLIESLPG